MKTALGLLLLSCSMMASANDNSTMEVNANNPNFVVSLPANPTTGFQWKVVHFDKNLLTLSSSTFERPKTNLIGAGGQMHFTFALQKGKSYPASTVIVLKYARSWEPETATVKKITVNFVKTDGN
ncbi:secreted protein [Legionella steigerwaltii]|uniref:Secreted protein n=1 Tax=Legionella steigerwaltii TaxID=460 RepID=A0A378L9I6_9GAMM|nr:protease inhibitor I42 family protein [Legionella steigerwaltii]KTD80938.1 secreted protein [Legionella steigerwaltii]STY23374.1 secreted protein [Legionella steigerwaltii]